MIWRDLTDRSLGKLLEGMETGDILIAAEISRIARSTLQVLEILDLATKKGITIHLVKEGFVMDGSLQSEMMASLFGIVATFERRLIGARTKEALARRKAAGLPVGRPPGKTNESRKLDQYKDEILGYIEKGVSLASISKIVGSSRRGLYNWLQDNQLPTTKKAKANEAQNTSRAATSVPANTRRAGKRAGTRA